MIVINSQKAQKRKLGLSISLPPTKTVLLVGGWYYWTAFHELCLASHYSGPIGLPANCHIWGIVFLYSFFGLNGRFVTHTIMVTKFADEPLIFGEVPLILMIFATLIFNLTG